MQTIYITSDHGAVELKTYITNFLAENFSEKFTVEDLGPDGKDSVDYPEFGKKLGKKIQENPTNLGIALCGSGIGISIAVNKVPNVRAALCNSVELAKLGREHNGAQVLCMGQRTGFIDSPEDILRAFLETSVDQSERHIRRRNLLDS